MNIPVSEAKGQLTELIRRAEAGEEIVLTRHGHPAVRLTPVNLRKATERGERRRILEDIQAEASAKATAGRSAARSQDFLYDEYGLPK